MLNKITKESGSKRKKKILKEPQVVISMRVSRAAQAIDVSEPYLLKAIREGRLKAVTKRAEGAGRKVTLILVDELRRFAAEDEGVEMASGRHR